MIITANYHYVEGTFNKKILDAVRQEYGTYKHVKYQNANITVKFNINFIPEKNEAAVNKYDGKNGENRLANVTTKDDGRGVKFEESDFQQVGVDLNKLKTTPALAYNEEGNFTVELPDKEKDKREISTIIHGIGHNLGLIHADGDAMNDQHTKVTPAGNDIFGKKAYTAKALQNDVSHSNAQSLVDRVDDMSSSGYQSNGESNYWQNKTETTTGGQVSIEATGVTTITKE